VVCTLQHFTAQVIQWVKEIGSAHVEVISQSSNEREAQEMLKEHRMFMENDATVRYHIYAYCKYLLIIINIY